MQYKELIVWQKAHGLALETIVAVKQVPQSYAADIMVKQLLRAVTSIGANIAEGYGRFTNKEYIRFLHIAYGSSNEVDHWLSLLADSKILPSETAQGLIKHNEEIIKILTSMIKKLQANNPS